MIVNRYLNIKLGLVLLFSTSVNNLLIYSAGCCRGCKSCEKKDFRRVIKEEEQAEKSEDSSKKKKIKKPKKEIKGKTKKLIKGILNHKKGKEIVNGAKNKYMQWGKNCLVKGGVGLTINGEEKETFEIEYIEGITFGPFINKVYEKENCGTPQLNGVYIKEKDIKRGITKKNLEIRKPDEMYIKGEYKKPESKEREFYIDVINKLELKSKVKKREFPGKDLKIQNLNGGEIISEVKKPKIEGSLITKYRKEKPEVKKREITIYVGKETHKFVLDGTEILAKQKKINNGSIVNETCSNATHVKRIKSLEDEMNKKL